ncbi:hypothetical protein WR25_26768 [Diploscapter pachys]|uniref:Uncharacterized protein n=1 Tax=Diploscapter pachys TaxID=2018661 RepID=A0A2A2LJ34_9BILA|nr:hypothetical protein WR25_26768 [Diploscapter pachys]
MADGTSTRFSRLAILEDQVGKPKTLSSRYYPFENRELVIVRHAETINEVFTDWLQRSQLSETSYVPFDLNMPVTLERRPNMRKSYESDPPISELSDTFVKKFAYELKDRCVVPTFIYCSPKYACLQTAMLIQKIIRHNLQYANHCMIRIDSCLDTTYNWMQHYFNKDDIERMGGVVDRTYQGPKMQKARIPFLSFLLIKEPACYQKWYLFQIGPNQGVYLPAIVTNVHAVFDQIKAQPEGVTLIITDSLAMRVLHNSLESNCAQHTIAVDQC